MLWQAELNAGPIDTPERRADLERRLMAQAGLIADRTVQNEYRRFFAIACSRCREAGQAGAAAASRRGVAVPRRAAARRRPSLPPPLPPLPGRRNREIVLGIFIAHPALIDEWVEDLAAIDFPEPELDNLRWSILEVAEYRPGA